MQRFNDQSRNQLRDHLLELLTQRGLPQTLSEFKNAISNRSEAHRQVVEMEVQYNELQREFFAGQISKESESVESNRLTKNLIDLIERLETDPGLLSARKGKQRKWMRWVLPALLLIVGLAAGYWFLIPDDPPLPPTAGQVLYSIPPKMQVGQETKCMVRIAPISLPERILSEGTSDTIHKKIESIRIGEVMTVDLVDEDAAFRVVSKNRQEQLIEANDYTQWIFDVTPLKQGKHELTLKISVRVWLDENRDVFKDVLTLERNIEIVSEPVELDTSWVYGDTLHFAMKDEPNFEDVQQPNPTSVPPPLVDVETRPDEADLPGEDKVVIKDKETVGDNKGKDFPVRPNRPGRFTFCKDNFQLPLFLESFSKSIEAKNIGYNTEPLSDCSGIFLRLCKALQEECPNAAFPSAESARDSRSMARWYAEHHNLQIVEDASTLSRKIAPGMVLFYGHQRRSYQNITIDSLTRSDGIEHVGVVVSVEKDQSGQVASYTLFHGRSTGKPAGRTTHYLRHPSREELPPYGNWDQQLVATAFMLTMPKEI